MTWKCNILQKSKNYNWNKNDQDTSHLDVLSVSSTSNSSADPFLSLLPPLGDKIIFF